MVRAAGSARGSSRARCPVRWNGRSSSCRRRRRILALPEGSAQRAKLEATGSVGIRDLHLLTDLALDAEGGFEGLTITDGEPWAAMIGPNPDWSVKGTADLQAGDLQIDALSLKGDKAEIGGSGTLAAFGQRIAASLNGELTDIAPWRALRTSMPPARRRCMSCCNGKRRRQSN